MDRPAPEPAYTAWLDTPFGPMLSVATERTMLLLEFEARRGLTRSLERLGVSYDLGPGRTGITSSIERELNDYFAGRSPAFATALELRGTEFQVGVWRQLQNVPPASTVSYLELATRVGNPRGVRAVAQANGANRLAVVVPCHRVVEAGGGLGGYGAGVEIKRKLLELERAAYGKEARLF